MVSQCANPSCSERFKYLGEGKLFLDNPIEGLRMSQQQLFEKMLLAVQRVLPTVPRQV